jgi:hypothetical protein
MTTYAAPQMMLNVLTLMPKLIWISSYFKPECCGQPKSRDPRQSENKPNTFAPRTNPAPLSCNQFRIRRI